VEAISANDGRTEELLDFYSTFALKTNRVRFCMLSCPDVRPVSSAAVAKFHEISYLLAKTATNIAGTPAHCGALSKLTTRNQFSS